MFSVDHFNAHQIEDNPDNLLYGLKVDIIK